MYALRLSVLLLLSVGFQVGASEPVTKSDIDLLMKRLGEITGLAPRRSVPAATIDKAHLKSFLETQIKADLRPSDIRAEELSLKKLGLVPKNFDLASSTVDLMTEQAAAFYDYRKKKLFLVDTDGGKPDEGNDTEVLAHELAHALADQHFKLNRYLHKGKTDDSSMARMAVMEGQATWLMYEIQAEGAGKTLVSNPVLLEGMGAGTEGRSEQYPVLNSTPLYMRASLIFPYFQGLRFQQAVQAKLGKAGFAEVFRRPPANAQQILHPEKYLSNTAVESLDYPVVISKDHFRDLNSGTLGEFDHAILLEQYVSKEEARTLAAGWRAGLFRLIESKSVGHRVALLYASLWDTEDNAFRMFADYQRVQSGKWKSMQVSREEMRLVAGEGDDGFFCTRVDGRYVTSVEGMRSLEDAVASAGATAAKYPRTRYGSKLAGVN